MWRPHYYSTAHCNAPILFHHRLLISRLKDPASRSSRMSLIYPNSKFSETRASLKDEINALVDAARK